MEVLEGQERAALSASISYHIKKFLTIPLILKIITSHFYADTHIKTRVKLRSHPTHNNPTAWGEEEAKHFAARCGPGNGKFVVV